MNGSDFFMRESCAKRYKVTRYFDDNCIIIIHWKQTTEGRMRVAYKGRRERERERTENKRNQKDDQIRA